MITATVRFGSSAAPQHSITPTTANGSKAEAKADFSSIEIGMAAFGQERTSAERFTEGADERSVASLRFLKLGTHLFHELVCFLPFFPRAGCHFLIPRFHRLR